MKPFHKTFLLCLATCLTLTHCGREDVATLGGDDTIIIANYTFSPTTLTAPAGSIIVFYNGDAVPHRILSQSGNDLFDDTGDLDSDIIPTGSYGAVEIPATAASGSQMVFYDYYLEGEMATPNGIITVE